MIDSTSWTTVYPEIALLVMACVIALVDLLVTSPKRTVTYVLTLVSLGGVALLHALYADAGHTLYGFGRLVVSDPMGHWLKCFATIAVMVTLVYARPYAAERDMLRGGEIFSLSVFALLGAMKYFVLGAMASGFLLYGMSMLYGATGSLDLATVFKVIASGQVKHQVLVFGLVFVVAGLAFKLGVVPFHMWVPDVYQGAPTAATLMIAGAPKLAAFAIAIRLLVEGLLPLAIDWQQMLALLAIASLLVGNLAAIAQTNLKRMLAYSTIAQMGFVLIGLMAGVVGGNAAMGANAYSSAMFYVVGYVLTTLATFGIILLLARQGFESEEITDLAGLNNRSPLYAGVMAICMFSLAGIPPMVGFYAKLSVLQALVASGQTADIALAVFAVAMSLVGAFYYLRVVKVMYFDEAVTATTVTADTDVRLVLSINGLLVLVLGIVPGALMSLCARSVSQMLAN
ncbi:MAG: NADH-quinone oxidoreductase subunit NuoN [Betaproteobacteria bacterium]|nr:NADH-quinone oxidoreductase subunit NuoN [Betaproteobacteria bacterium]